MKKKITITAALTLAATSAAIALPQGLSGLTIGVGAGGLADGYVRGELDFMLSRYVCVGPELGLGFGDGRAFYGGGAARVYLIPGLHDVFQPHLAFGLGAAHAFDEDETPKVNEAKTGAYVNVAAGCDFDIPRVPVSSYVDAGGLFFPGDEANNDFKIEVGVRFSMGRVRRLEKERQARIAEAMRLEEERLARIAEEERVAQKLAEVEDANSRGDYHEAIKISKEVLAAHPGHAEADELLQESERLLAESLRGPAPRPWPTPKPEPEVVKRTIPPEAVEAYGRGKAALASGDIGGAIRILGAVVGEHPTYGAARGKLVDAYLLQGLDFYSRGELTAALKALRRALIYDPGNAKVKRYIKRVEGELK
jgi:tetratricopeptide (TPR) repeat protein